MVIDAGGSSTVVVNAVKNRNRKNSLDGLVDRGADRLHCEILELVCLRC